MVCTKHFLSELQVLILLCVAIFTVLSRSYNLYFKGSSPIILHAFQNVRYVVKMDSENLMVL